MIVQTWTLKIRKWLTYYIFIHELKHKPTNVLLSHSLYFDITFLFLSAVHSIMFMDNARVLLLFFYHFFPALKTGRFCGGPYTHINTHTVVINYFEAIQGKNIRNRWNNISCTRRLEYFLRSGAYLSWQNKLKGSSQGQLLGKIIEAMASPKCFVTHCKILYFVIKFKYVYTNK